MAGCRAVMTGAQKSKRVFTIDIETGPACAAVRINAYIEAPAGQSANDGLRYRPLRLEAHRASPVHRRRTKLPENHRACTFTVVFGKVACFSLRAGVAGGIQLGMHGT